MQTLYGMADLFIIGKFNGVESTTAVSIGSQVMHMLTVMVVGLAMGTTVSIGYAIGAKNRKQASDTIGNHFCFSGYFCACGRSELSFLHNFIAIICVRIPLAYVASNMFADTLFPMGLAAPGGSFLSVIICVIAYFVMGKKSS